MVWSQIVAIAWAQFRVTRNHLPRTDWGTVLMWLLSAIWYGMYVAIAVVVAQIIPVLESAELRDWAPIALLGVFLFWQLLPLLTLSTGRSLQLNKLQVYPVSDKALFGVEVLLRLTTAPEMLILLSGAFAGLLSRSDIPLLAPFLLVLFVPFNLFLSLGVRDWMLHNFERNRFRELFAIVLFSIGILPQLIARTRLGHALKPKLIALANGSGSPWKALAQLSTGHYSGLALASLFFWIGLAYLFARRQFVKTLLSDDTFVSATRPRRRPKWLDAFASLPSRLFRDPVAAIVQKEFQSLVRMPRFRVVFGMACFFSCFSLLPITSHDGSKFVSGNFPLMVNLYGLLLLGDLLLWNTFGFDRQAAQIYFVSPVRFQAVLQAKNITAIMLICVQSFASLLLASLFLKSFTVAAAMEAISASAVAALFFTAVGNLSSVAIPRGVDPTQTFRKQAGAKVQIWLLLCVAASGLLLGFAFLARWALRAEWAFFSVLAVEFAVGVVAYRFALQSAVKRGWERREEILDALSKHAGPVSSQSA